MTEIKNDNLEDALNKKDEDGKQEVSHLNRASSIQKPKVSKDMEIGFHQGALNTLINERNELVRMIQQAESVMQAHIKRLEELGVKIKVGNKNQGS